MEKGLIHIYCGDGKGKTTAAMGLALRCCGHKNKVLIAQFLKSRPSGELESLALLPTVEVIRAKASNKFSFQMSDEEKEQALADHMEMFNKVIEKVKGEKIDLLIFDEALGACKTGLLNEQELIKFLKEKPKTLEVVLTGRDPSEELLEIADYVSEVCKIKHPFDEGISARTGIER